MAYLFFIQMPAEQQYSHETLHSLPDAIWSSVMYIMSIGGVNGHRIRDRMGFVDVGVIIGCEVGRVETI